MKIISHRGNVSGINPEEENKPEKIIEISKKYRVEIDVWKVNGSLYLGHDNNSYPINTHFLINNNTLVHCKNLECFEYLSKFREIESFYQSEEKIVITSAGNYLYHSSVSLGKDNIEGSIHVHLDDKGDVKHLNKTNSLVTDFVNSYIK